MAFTVSLLGAQHNRDSVENKPANLLIVSLGKTLNGMHNGEVKRKLKVDNNGKILPFFPVPTYRGAKLDRALTYRHHLKVLRKKPSTCILQLRRLVGLGCDDGATTLRTAALSLIYSTAECCAPAWYCSAHTRLIDSVLNEALRIVTECLRSTPTNKLPVLSGIQPDELRRLEATLAVI